MNTRLTRSILAAITVGLTLVVLLSAAGQDEAGRARAKGAEKVKAGPAPRTADGKTDFSGIWSPDRNFIYDLHDALKKGEGLPLQPWAEKLARERMSKDDPEALCLPAGVPRQAPYPWRIVQTGTHAFFLFEGNIHSYRQISSTAGRIRRTPIRPGTATPWAGGKAKRCLWIRSGSTTSSGSTSRAILTRSSCT